jgi:hypothetical protein
MELHHKEIVKLLKRLTLVFPHPKQSKETIELYADHLEDLSLYAIREAVDHHIRYSKWFPRISELRAVGSRFVGYEPRFQLFADDELIRKVWALEHAFYHEGEFDLEAWTELAEQFEADDRIEQAEAIRKRLPHYQQTHAKWMAEEEEEDEDWDEQEEDQAGLEEDQREPVEKTPELRGVLEY